MKSVFQPYVGNGLHGILNECLIITYNAIAYAQDNGIDNRKEMKGFYRTLKDTKLPSCYKLAATTRACAVLTSRKKTQKRGFEIKHRKPLRLMTCIISGFFITMKGRLFVPLSRDRYFDVLLNRHAVETLDGKKIRSLTTTPGALSFCYSEDVEPLPARAVYGVDRNEKNLTFGNKEGVIMVDMAKTVRLRQTTREIIGSFKRNDVRVRRILARKYWKRTNDRTNQILHAATNFMVETAVKNGAAFAFEDLTDIGRMYRKGLGEGRDYRFRLNSWPHWKAKRMLEYKAAWQGVTMIPLTRSDTYATSTTCSACGERTHNPEKGDAVHRRMLWCRACKAWMDGDANAALNLSKRGLARFASSFPRLKSRSQQALEATEKGLAGEAVKGNPTQTVILRVNASKLGRRHPMVGSHWEDTTT